MSEYHGWRHGVHGTDPVPGLGATAPMWPTWYSIPLDSASAINDFKDEGPGHWTWADDATYRRGGYYGVSTNDAMFDFKVRLGPAYSSWTITSVLETGPDCGKLQFELLKISDDDDIDTWANPLGLMSAYYITTYAFSGPLFTAWDNYAAGQTKKSDTLSPVWRIGAGAETVMTTPTLSTDADGYKITDTGPGLYVLRVHVNGKSGSSSNYKQRLSCLDIVRCDGRGES